MKHDAPSPEPHPTKLHEFIRSLLGSLNSSLGKTLRSRAIWRLAVSLTVIQILAFLLLGIGFFIMALGLTMAALHLAPIARPANKLLTALSGNPAGQPVLPLLQMRNWSLCLFILPAGVYLLLAAFGVRIVATQGFLTQNLLYHVFGR